MNDDELGARAAVLMLGSIDYINAGQTKTARAARVVYTHRSAVESGALSAGDKPLAARARRLRVLSAPSPDLRYRLRFSHRHIPCSPQTEPV